jgi:hypothetical protein
MMLVGAHMVYEPSLPQEETLLNASVVAYKINPHQGAACK